MKAGPFGPAFLLLSKDLIDGEMDKMLAERNDEGNPEATEERLQVLQTECKMLTISGYSEYIFPICGHPYSTK